MGRPHARSDVRASVCVGVSYLKPDSVYLRDNPGDYRCGICTSSARRLASDPNWETYWKTPKEESGLTPKEGSGFCLNYGWAPNLDAASCKKRCQGISGCLGVSYLKPDSVYLRDNPGDYRCGICTPSTQRIVSDPNWETYWNP